MPSCIEQITQKGSAEGSKVLSTGINNKIVITQWRLNVFERLEKILKILVHEKALRETYNKPPTLGIQSHYGLYPRLQLIQNGDGLSMSDLSRQNHIYSKEFSLNQFAYKLSSILLDTWTEVATTLKKSRRALNKDCGLVLSKVIGILQYLVRLCDDNDENQVIFSLLPR